MEERAARSGEIRLAYYVDGPRDGEAVVMANGVGISHRLFHDLACALRDDYRVLTWDYRGLPGSDPIDGREALSTAEHAGDLRAIMNAEGIESAHLLAWCSGARVIGLAAHETPRLARSLTFLNGAFATHTDARLQKFEALAGALERGRGARATEAALPPALLGMLRSFSEPARPELIDSLLADVERAAVAHDLFDLDGRGRAGCALAYHKLARTADLARFLRIQGALNRLDLLPLLRATPLPALFVTGTADTMAPPARAQAAARACPRGELFVVPGGSHYCFLESPELVGARVRTFLRGAALSAHAQPGPAPSEIAREVRP